MEHFEFLTSIDINQDKRLFIGKTEYSTRDYKNEKNYDFNLVIYNVLNEKFLELSKKLEVNQKHHFTDDQYTSRVPIYVKIETSYFKGKRSEAIQLSDFINNFITVYEYFSNDFGIPSFVLDGRKIFKKDFDDWKEIEYEALSAHSFYDVIKESIIYGEGSTDLICLVASEKEPFDIGWKVYLDAIRLFYAGNFRQSIINCITAVECEVTKPAEVWLQNQTFSKDSSLSKSASRELGNPLRFELFINAINPMAFNRYTPEEKGTLITNFKVSNTIRNKIAHEGIPH